MEKLITCSRVLYDKDISDKMKEIISLRNELNKYKKPEIEYSNYEEWYSNKKKAFNIIKDGLTKWIIEDVFEYNHMLHQGLTSRQQYHIAVIINDALDVITKNKFKGWTNTTAWNIVYGIEGFFNGFIDTGIWDLIYSFLEPEMMLNVIYNNIIWQLDDETHSHSILEDIYIFTCINCKKKYSGIYGEELCFECSEDTEYL